MMTDVQLVNALQFFAVTAAWVFVFFKMIPDWRLDSFRQDMFVVRDELFDYAAAGNISFDHPAYKLLRRQMNGFIRYGHHLSVFRGLMTAAIHKLCAPPDRPDWSEQWSKELESIKDHSVRRRLEQFHKRAMMLAIKRLLTGSPLLWLVTLVVMLQLLSQGAARGIRQLARAAAKKTFSGPTSNRLIEEAAQGHFA